MLPRAEVIVNPNLAGIRFASPALAGVGVAFYVVAALAQGAAASRISEPRICWIWWRSARSPTWCRSIATIGSWWRKGCGAFAPAAACPAFARCSNRPAAALEQLTAADLGFAVAPRLNAAGRLTDMSVGIACLLADDPEQAAALAAQLAQLNEERREIEQRMQLEAVELAAAVRFDDAGSEALGLCLFDESWHQGVVGLVAGRIKDRLHRPVIAFARAEDGSLRGSARSVPGINIRDALDSIADPPSRISSTNSAATPWRRA